MLGELFDPKAELYVHDRLRPHWSQAGAIVFVTFRTKDSIPRDVLARWEREKQEWVDQALAQSRGSLRGPTSSNSARRNSSQAPTSAGSIDSDPRWLEWMTTQKTLDHGVIHDFAHWSQRLTLLDEKQRYAFESHFERCREMKLDECLGACVFKRPELARIVAESLLYFDGDRYRMGNFVVMPNHVHFLAAFATREVMERQFASWLRFTATQINRRLGTSGHLWQQEPFDHLVRSVEQYDYLRRYIAENPTKAGLGPGEYLYRRYAG